MYERVHVSSVAGPCSLLLWVASSLDPVERVEEDVGDGTRSGTCLLHIPMPEMDSQHALGGSQLSLNRCWGPVTPFWPLWALYIHGPQTYMQAKHKNKSLN